MKDLIHNFTLNCFILSCLNCVEIATQNGLLIVQIMGFVSIWNTTSRAICFVKKFWYFIQTFKEKAY